jgi:hypothetical protein
LERTRGSQLAPSLATVLGAPFNTTLERMGNIVAVRLLALFLVVAAGYIGWWSITADQLLWLIAATVALVGAMGLALGKRWSVYVWYVIALSASALWVVTVVRVAIAGWPYPDAISSVISLAPGVLLLMVWIFGSIAVRKHFRHRDNAL